MILESLDDQRNNLVINITVHRNSEIISAGTEEELPSKSLWNASIHAYGCETNTHTTRTELSKLITVIENDPGTVLYYYHNTLSSI